MARSRTGQVPSDAELVAAERCLFEEAVEIVRCVGSVLFALVCAMLDTATGRRTRTQDVTSQDAAIHDGHQPLP